MPDKCEHEPFQDLEVNARVNERLFSSPYRLYVCKHCHCVYAEVDPAHIRGQEDLDIIRKPR